MFKNHVLITVRRLSRKKGYAILNVAGLSLGLAVFGILMLFVRYELSYERFHEKADRIHMLIYELGPEFQRTASAIHPLIHGRLVQEHVPEVEHVVSVSATGFSVIHIDGILTPVTDIDAYHVGNEVFDVFTFPLIAGDPHTALANPRTAVVDQKTAIQLFGTDDPDAVIGRTFEREFLYEIAGLMENVPPNTMWRPNVLMSEETYLSDPESWYYDPRASFLRTFILYHTSDVEPDVLSKAADEGLEELSHRTNLAFYSQPITDIHLHGENTTNAAAGELTRLRIFTLVAVLILLLAIINYVNLATAYGMQRTREVGVRRTLGATRAQIVVQSLLESLALALLAGLIGLGLLAVAMPHFSDAVQIEMTFGWELPIVSTFVGIALLTGLVAGLYPSLTLSGARPNEVFRTGTTAGKGGARFRQSLVVFQFNIGIALVIASLVIVRQIGFMQSGSQGIQPDHIIEFELGYSSTVSAQDAVDRIRSVPQVTDVAAGWLTPGGKSSGQSGFLLPGETDSTIVYVQEIRMEAHAQQLMGMELVAGDWITDADLPAVVDTSPDLYGVTPVRPILLNETAVRVRGWTPEEAVGKHFPFEEGPLVKGVVRDFHYASMRTEIEPVRIASFRISDRRPTSLLVGFEPGTDRATMDALHDIWKEMAPDLPFQAEFLKDRFEGFYGAERRLAGLFWAFGVIAIFIACLGLFGLAAFTAERRVKEVGIRKVLGAETSSIVRLLSMDLARLVVIAFVIAAPISWWAMSRWLDDFAYHITLGPGIFLLAGFGAVLMAVATISYHAIRAANADPVRSLRSE